MNNSVDPCNTYCLSDSVTRFLIDLGWTCLRCNFIDFEWWWKDPESGNVSQIRSRGGGATDEITDRVRGIQREVEDGFKP